nr:glycosyltransferase [uncultured Rhodopila sp.]
MLTVEPINVYASLIERVADFYGQPLIASLPDVTPDGDHAAAFEVLLEQVQQSSVVVFAAIRPGDLDAFFHLRLAEILKDRPPLRSVSVVELSSEAGALLAAGFADRFRSAWPFERCVFVTDGGDASALTRLLGLPVATSDSEPEILRTEARSGQKIALQLQAPWRRCGSTTAFENQIEDLVKAGLLTIRLFTSGQARRGPTLDARLETVIRDNSTRAGAHINLLAVPDGPAAFTETDDPAVDWATWLGTTASCHIRDSAVIEAAKRADSVIANDIGTVGPALHLAPRARLLLDVHDDAVAASREWMLLAGKSETETAAAEAAATQVRARVLAIPDICTHASVTELARLAVYSQRSAIVVPRIYLPAAVPSVPPKFDILLAGDEHDFSIASLRWFLDEVWRPYLEPFAVRVVIAGRAGDRMVAAEYASPLLHFQGDIADPDRLRSSCRMTVVADRAGSGIAIKLLAALAAGHPLVTTPIGIRGLDHAVASLLPAFDDPGEFAADILELLRDPERLAERQSKVAQAHEALQRGRDYADLLRSVPLPSTHVIRRRLAEWASLTAAALPRDNTVHQFALDEPFSTTGSKWDHQVLIRGWHDAEPWGRWTDGAEASLQIELAAPIDEPLRLELDIVPTAVASPLTLSVDAEPFEAVQPGQGVIGWDLPPGLTAGKNRLIVTLRVAETVCAARTGTSPDDRIIGIGVSAVRLVSRQAHPCDPGRYIPIRSDAMPRNLLLAGWHPAEEWGCWSNGNTASFQLTFARPLRGSHRLELNLMPSPAGGTLTLSVNDRPLPPVSVSDGTNRWILPPEVTAGQTRLLIVLSVSVTFCPKAAGTAADDRILGVGLRGIKLLDYVPGTCAVGRPLALAPPMDLDGILLEGWHPSEGWGTWTNARGATLRLTLGEAMSGSFALEFEFAARAIETTVTVSVNGFELPGVHTSGGLAVWRLPASCTDGQRDLVVGLQVADTFRPADLGASRDDRDLGIGVRSVTLIRESAAICPIGPKVAVSSSLGESGMLVDGWHQLEPWGCWTTGTDATMIVQFGTLLEGTFVLQMDLVPPLLDRQVDLVVNGIALEPIDVVDGLNEWMLPRDSTDGQSVLTIGVHVEHPARPLDVKESSDDRLLGIGLRTFRIVPIS